MIRVKLPDGDVRKAGFLHGRRNESRDRMVSYGGRLRAVAQWQYCQRRVALPVSEEARA
jgi:hypothetical protein